MKSIKALIITKLALVLAVSVDPKEASLRKVLGINLASNNASRKVAMRQASSTTCCISPFPVEIKETHMHKVDVNFAKKIPNADQLASPPAAPAYTCGEYECSPTWVSWPGHVGFLCQDSITGCTDDLCCIGPKCTTHECSDGMEQYNDNKGVRLGNTDDCCCQKRGTSAPSVTLTDPPGCIAPPSPPTAPLPTPPPTPPPTAPPPTPPPPTPPPTPPTPEFEYHPDEASLKKFILDQCAVNISFVSKVFGGCTQTYQTSLLQNFESLFKFAVPTFAGIDMNGWNTAAVTSMKLMFYFGGSFNQEINGWNTAAVTDMANMFYFGEDRGVFDQEVNGWNTAAVTDMTGLFGYTGTFNQEVNGWNTAAVTSMRLMFYNGKSFDQEVNGWNTAAVTNVYKMFNNGKSFDQEVNGWNTAAVTNNGEMFDGATAFNQAVDAWNTVSLPSGL